MSAQVYSLPCQTEGTRKTFLEEESIDLSYKLTYESNDNHYKNVHRPLSTLPVVIGNTMVVFKTNQ